jgi:hypothetical protein
VNDVSPIVTPARTEDVPGLLHERGYVKTYVIDVNTSSIPEEGSYSPSWPNGVIIIIIILYCHSVIAEAAFP